MARSPRLTPVMLSGPLAVLTLGFLTIWLASRPGLGWLAVILVLGAALVTALVSRGSLALARSHRREAITVKMEMVNRLALAAEYQDDGRSGHNFRIQRGSELVARQLGLSPERARVIGKAALLHDIGKIGVPHTILAKPGALDADERAAVEGHSLYGAHLLVGSDDPILLTGHAICLTHHERWDGKGYPNGMMGEAIPIEGRIVAVVDVFDALTSPRPYKDAWSVEEARQAIVDGSGAQFDPKVVDAFLEVLPEVEALRAGTAQPALA